MSLATFSCSHRTSDSMSRTCSLGTSLEWVAHVGQQRLFEDTTATMVTMAAMAAMTAARTKRNGYFRAVKNTRKNTILHTLIVQHVIMVPPVRNLASTISSRARATAVAGLSRCIHASEHATLRSLAGRDVVFFVPAWPEVDGSAAGVRTARLAAAFQEWGCRVAFSSAASRTVHTERLESLGYRTFALPLNDAMEARHVLEATEPDMAIFDRFYTEEALSHAVRSMRPRVLRMLDMQDCHALRLARQRTVEAGGSIVDSMHVRPAATDTSLARELSAIHRSDLTLVCSTVEERWLRETCGVPAHKLAYAPLFAASEELLPARALGFERRSGFVSLGTFRHAPNVDAARFLAREVWPRVRATLPEATVTIIGSHPSREHVRLLQRPEVGMYMEGHATATRLASALGEARVLLAPLRFGAGLKGKVAEAWAYGTPVATSPIGSEGMLSADWRAEESAVEAAAETAAADGGWGGLWQSTEADSLARDAARLHSDARLWERCSSRGRALCRTLFDEESLFEQLHRSVAHALTTLRERRAADYPAAMLWHHRQRSTDFFSRWIEAKNAQKDSPSG